MRKGQGGSLYEARTFVVGDSGDDPGPDGCSGVGLGHTATGRRNTGQSTNADGERFTADASSREKLSGGSGKQFP